MASNECSICFDIVDVNDIFTSIKSNCNHYFHVDCIKQWIYKKNDCPNCRYLQPFNYSVKLQISNEHYCYEYKVEKAIINSELVKKIIESEFPHLLAAGYEVIIGSIEINLNQETELKCYYRPID